MAFQTLEAASEKALACVGPSLAGTERSSVGLSHEGEKVVGAEVGKGCADHGFGL